MQLPRTSSPWPFPAAQRALNFLSAPGATGGEEPRDGRDQMNQQDEGIAHPGSLAIKTGAASLGNNCI